MPILSPEYKEVISDSVGVFAVALVIFLFAAALHFLVEFCVEHHMPGYMTWTMWGVSVFAFYGDAYVTALSITKIIVRATRDFGTAMKPRP